MRCPSASGTCSAALKAGTVGRPIHRSSVRLLLAADDAGKTAWMLSLENDHRDAAALLRSAVGALPGQRSLAAGWVTRRKSMSSSNNGLKPRPNSETG